MHVLDLQACPASGVSRVWPHVQEQQSSQWPHASPWRIRLDKEGKQREREREREREMSAFGVGVRRGWGGSECVRYAWILNCSFTINFSCVHVYIWLVVGGWWEWWLEGDVSECSRGRRSQ